MGEESSTRAGTPVRAVFLSYASQDAEAAQRICEALVSAGLEVWFDQNALRGGDAWDRKIRRQIHNCALFLPVISAHSDARSEGYFRREWRLAVDRTADIADDVTFLLPVVIDNTPDATARVPDRFREVQWSRLPGGIPTPEFLAHVHALLPRQGAAPASPSAATPSASADGAHREPDRVKPAAVAALPRRPGRTLAIFGVITLGVVVAGYFAIDRWVLSKRSPQSSFVAAQKSIAVLPFVDMSEKHDQAYFGDGIAEEILDLLAKIPGLTVIGRTSSFQFRANASDLRKIGAALGVAYIVEGSVRKSDDRIKVAVQLIDARDGTHRWSDTYERDATNAMTLQRQIAIAVARELQVSVSDYFGAGGTTKSTEAYDLYLRGIRDVDIGDREGELRAIPELSKAVEIDPGYVNAWVGLADAYDSAATDNTSRRAESYLLARSAVDKALALDPNDADAYAMRAFIRINTWDWSGAEEDIRRSVSLRKTSAAAQAAAKLATARGSLLDAEELLRGVLATDPLDTYTLAALAYVVYPSLGRFADSDRLLARIRDINPNSLNINAARSFNALSEGDYELALRSAESETEATAKEVALATVYTAMGKTVESKQALERLLRIPTATEFDVACVYAYQGERDLALQYLERAFGHHSPDLVLLKTEPLLSNVRTAATYRTLLRRMGLPE
jgi:TolB-like protein